LGFIRGFCFGAVSGPAPSLCSGFVLHSAIASERAFKLYTEDECFQVKRDFQALNNAAHKMNPEKATDYLSRVNWKSLVEWMTAEAILNRPANPVQFCRDLLGEKLAEQASQDFKPDNVTDWLRGCYTEATALVDEHGIIQGKTLESAQASLPEQLTEMKRMVVGMNKLMDAASTIATLDPHQATDNIVAETCRILNCDRATIFTVDMITSELVLSVAEGAKNIRVPIGHVSTCT
jgi:hypothetical protein